MRFTFTVDVEIEVDHQAGESIRRAEIVAQLRDALEDANPDSITTDDDATYGVVSFEVTEEEQPKPPRQKRAGSSKDSDQW